MYTRYNTIYSSILNKKQHDENIIKISTSLPQLMQLGKVMVYAYTARHTVSLIVSDILRILRDSKIVIRDKVKLSNAIEE